MQYLYDVYDKQKNDLICQGKTASQIEQLIGIKSRHVSYYVSRQMNYNKRYLITSTQNKTQNILCKIGRESGRRQRFLC